MAKLTKQRLLGFEAEEVASGSPESAVGSATALQDPGAGGQEPGARSQKPATNPKSKIQNPKSPLPVPGQSVYLVDAHSLIYQVFHALPEMSGPSGQPVGAVHGFVRDIVDLIEVRGADYVIAAFDHPGPTFRNDLYDQYKIHREEMPADLQLQIPVILRFLEALGVPSPSLAGFEADDILATLARQVEAAGAECFLVTSDKDCRQLITDHVKMFNIRKGEVFDAAALRATWGIRPDQVVDFQSLVGDKVDNVPGVPLIGPKNAQELLTKYQTLEGVFEHAHEVAGAKRKENLMSGREQAMKSRELVRLKADVPIAIDWNAAQVGRFHPDLVDTLCRECGFRQLARRIESLAVKLGRPPLPLPVSQHQGASLEDEAEAAAPPAPAKELTTAASPAWNATYKTIATLADLDWLVGELSRQPRFVIDTETTAVLPRWAEIVGYSFCWKPGEAYYLPVRAPAGEAQLDPAMAAAALKPVLENPQIAKVGQNLKYDLVVLRSAGIDMQGVAFDTMVADYLLDPGERSHNMDDMARRYLGHQTITIDQLIGTGKDQKQMDAVPVELVTQYAAEDADVPLRLAQLLAPRLEEQCLTQLFTELEMPLVEVLAELEFTGIRVDVSRLRELSSQFNGRIIRLEREIFEIAGREFNIDSRIQLGQLLYDELKLPVLRRTKTGPSMDADVLEELAALHPLPAKVIEYRQNAKLKSTYVDALQELVHPQTGRVHTSFKQDVAATGRLSSQDPNLQNIPIRTEQGREIRSAFLPGHAGWMLLTAD